MKYHYAIEAVIRYYGVIPEDVAIENGGVTASQPSRLTSWGIPEWRSEKPFHFSGWKEPPHLVFANLRLKDFAAVSSFVRRYGYIAGKLQAERYRLDLAQLEERQALVRDAWIGSGEESKLALDVGELNRHIGLTVGSRKSEIDVDDLWTLIEILVLRDLAAEDTEVCPNKSCPSPYFLKARKGQKFCSRACSVLVSVHRHRERQKKAMKLLEATERQKSPHSQDRRK